MQVSSYCGTIKIFFMRRPIPVLYEDEQLIAFDKPSGLLVIPSPKEKSKTLVNIVSEQCAAAKQYGLHPCHRLDRDTSGIVLFAKGKKNQQGMMLQEDKFFLLLLYNLVYKAFQSEESSSLYLPPQVHFHFL